LANLLYLISVPCPQNKIWGAGHVNQMYNALCFTYDVGEDLEEGDFGFENCNMWCTRDINDAARGNCGQNICLTARTPNPTKATATPTTPTTVLPTPAPEPEGNCPQIHPFLGTFATFQGKVCWKTKNMKTGNQLSFCNEWCTLDSHVGSEPTNNCNLTKQLCRTQEPSSSPTTTSPTQAPSTFTTEMPTNATTQVPATPTTTTKKLCDPWYKLFGGNCGQFCIGRNVGVCLVRDVAKNETLQKGDCAGMGFTEPLGMSKVSFKYELPMCMTSLHIEMYYKPTTTTLKPAETSESSEECTTQPECPTCPTQLECPKCPSLPPTTSGPTVSGFTYGPTSLLSATPGFPTNSPTVFRLKNTRIPECPEQEPCPYCPCSRRSSTPYLRLALSFLALILLI